MFPNKAFISARFFYFETKNSTKTWSYGHSRSLDRKIKLYFIESTSECSNRRYEAPSLAVSNKYTEKPCNSKESETSCDFLVQGVVPNWLCPQCDLDMSQGCLTHAEQPVFHTMFPIETAPVYMDKSSSVHKRIQPNYNMQTENIPI